ncbi:MAG: threonine ammonia-lyase [Pseudomonadota bacterium]|nr:threonine ammonia-lyase [Pseudomonadota bacterium]
MLQLTDIEQAAARIAGQVHSTPCLRSRTLSAITGAEVFLKFENHQFTASFKERGACNKLALLTEAARADGTPLVGVVAMSAGNHAQGVAFHAERLGIRAVIVMPRFTPGVKVARTRSLGAEVVLHGDTLDAAREHALGLAREQGLTLVHPYDDTAIMAGQGTLALEMLTQQPDIDTLVVPVGGGGLIGGVATAAKALKPGLRVVGVQAARFPGAVNALNGSAHAPGDSTIAEGIAVSGPGAACLPMLRAHVDEMRLVQEGDIEQAIVLLLEIEKTLAEGAGAAALAALLSAPDDFRGRKVGLVVSGGNIDPLLLANIIGRGMVRSGRLARLVVSTRDVPGSLARITALVAESGANVQAIHHQRAFTLLAAQHVEIELVLQTRDAAHVQALLARLREAGMKVSEAPMTG